MSDARHYRSLYRIRRVEEEVARIYPTDKIKSPVHLSIGQEAVAVGLCEALKPEDVVFGTYRGHALYLAKGGDLDAMIAELYGKVTGCARGKGGSMHLVDLSVGMMGTSAIVATNLPNAVGYAMALKLKKQDAIVACMFGDGATEEGAFHEAMNFASLKKLPVLFLCENNGYAIHARQQERHGGNDLCRLAAGYGIPTTRLDSSDSVELAAALSTLAEGVRAGNGPAFVEVMTYRWMEHVGPGEDWHFGYREAAEAAPWRENDPVQLVGRRLDAAERGEIERVVESDIADAFAAAEAAPFPDERELHEHVYQEVPAWSAS